MPSSPKHFQDRFDAMLEPSLRHYAIWHGFTTLGVSDLRLRPQHLVVLSNVSGLRVEPYMEPPNTSGLPGVLVLHGRESR